MERECRCPDDESKQIAATQHGLITLNQALDAGFTRRQIRWRLDSGQWKRMLPGIMAIAPPDDVWLQGLTAASLWTGDAVIVGLASAGLWQLEGIALGVIEIATATRKRHVDVIVHHGANFSHEDLIRHRGLLTTTPTRTLIDISGVVPEIALAQALDSALRRGLTFLPLMRTRLEAMGTQGRPGTGILQNLLTDRERAAGLAESPLEIKVEQVLRRHRLDPPERQYTVTCLDGTRVRLDFAWPEQRVGIEADGYRWHSDFEQWQRDARKHNLLQEMNWRIVRATDRSLRESPDALPRQVAALLGQGRRALEV